MNRLETWLMAWSCCVSKSLGEYLRGIGLRQLPGPSSSISVLKAHQIEFPSHYQEQCLDITQLTTDECTFEVVI